MVGADGPQRSWSCEEPEPKSRRQVTQGFADHSDLLAEAKAEKAKIRAARRRAEAEAGVASPRWFDKPVAIEGQKLLDTGAERSHDLSTEAHRLFAKLRVFALVDSRRLLLICCGPSLLLFLGQA